MSETKGKRRYRVALRTLVTMEVDVEASGFQDAVEKAARRVRPGDYFDGNDVAAIDNVNVEWAQDHAFAYVDEVGADGTIVTAAPALFAGSNLEIRDDDEAGWRLAADAEYEGKRNAG